METSIERVSTDSTGQQANQASFHAAISTDGRYVAFTSCATNLVDGESTGCDIFVKDLLTGETNRVNTDSAGQQGNSYSFGASISNDGRYVAFESYASNLVNGDTNGKVDIFVKDLVTGATTLVNTGIGGYQGIAGFQVNGHYVVFASNAANLVEGDTNRAYDVFIKDLFTGETTRVSTDSAGRQADGSSFHAAISADGRYVAFTSQARNLVDSDTNGQANIFVKDLVTGTTTLVSTGIAGHRAADDSDRPAISADGRYVAFSSDASNLVTGDTNGTSDIFVKDLLTGTTTRISTDSDGQQADKISGVPSISADGYYVTFWSWASNLVAGDSNRADDVFVKDLLTGTTTRVSTNDAGRQANGHSFPSTTTQSISADGRYVTFESSASNLARIMRRGWRV